MALVTAFLKVTTGFFTCRGSFAREVESLGGKCHTYTCDLTRRSDVYKVCERIKEEIGPVSILVNNAGIVGGKRILDLDDGE